MLKKKGNFTWNENYNYKINFVQRNLKTILDDSQKGYCKNQPLCTPCRYYEIKVQITKLLTSN